MRVAQSAGGAAFRSKWRIAGGSRAYPQRPSHAQGRVQPVFMKAVGPVGSAEMRAVLAANLAPPVLCRDGFPGEHGMEIRHAADDLARVDAAIRVQGHTELLLSIKRLQAVHVIRHRRRPAAVAGQGVVP